MGEICARGFLYKLAYKDQGSVEVAAFQAGQDRGDAALGLLMDVQSSYRLRVKNNVGTPATKIDINADTVAVLDGSGYAKVLQVVDLTVDCLINGANGLDTGVLATGWYGFYVIAKADGTVAGLASTSLSNPVMPSGYTYKKLVSVIYYTAGGTNSFKEVFQFDKEIRYNSNFPQFSCNYGSPTLLDISTAVPPNAVFSWLQPLGMGGIIETISWDIGEVKSVISFAGYSVPGNPFKLSPFKYPLNPSAPQTIYVSGTIGAQITIYGYELDI